MADFDSMAAAAKRLFNVGVRVVGLGAMEWHMQMALEHDRKQAEAALPSALSSHPVRT